MISTTSVIRELELVVTYDVTPALRGKWEHGVQVDPDYPADVEIVSVKINGFEILLTKAQHDSIREELRDELKL